MSQPLRIVHIEPLPEWIRDLYASAVQDSGLDLNWAGAWDDGDLLEHVHGAHALITGKRPITGDIIGAAGDDLRLIQVQGRAPWAADLVAARAAGIPVSFMPHRGAIAVAEHAIALVLGLTRKLVPGHIGTAAAAYRAHGTEPIRTDERTIAFNWLKFPDIGQLYGQTIGLIGLGDIGLEVTRRARAFDMTVLYHQRHPLPREHEAMVGARYAPLEELLRESDIVSLHAPHTGETERIIDSSALRQMKDTAVLINTARGGLVDEDALVESLRGRRIAGAGLDTFLDEPLPEGHPLLELDNVLLSPHVGGGTGGGQRGMVADVIANIERAARGEPPLHTADLS